MTIDPNSLIRDERDAEIAPLRGRVSAGLGDKGAVAGRMAEMERLLGEARLAARLAEERLALTFEAADAVGWWDWDIPVDRCRASAGFARLFGVDPAKAAEGLPRAVFGTAIHPGDHQSVRTAIERVAAAGGVFMHEFRVHAPGGGIVWILSRGRCERDAEGRPVRCSGVTLDITRRKASEARKSALVELGDRLRDIENVGEIAFIAAEVMAEALDASRAGFGVVDHAQDAVILQPDWCAPGVTSLAGLHRFRDHGSFVDELKRGETVVVADVATDPRTARAADALAANGVRVLLNLPVMEHGRFVFVVFVHHDRPHVWSEPDLAFVRNVADRTQAAIARLRAEEQRRLLHRELGHRLKNNQAMVQAIVGQTLRNAPDIETARSALTQRLAALGRANDVLVSGEAEDADARAIIEGALALHDDGQNRIRLDGPSLRIAAPVALSLALILHELATNAAKYGALSGPEGHVAVDWSIGAAGGSGALHGQEPAASEPMFRIGWRERDGPRVVPPDRRGFGTRLIARGLAGSTGGSIRLDYPADGFAFELVVPLADLVGRA